MTHFLKNLLITLYKESYLARDMLAAIYTRYIYGETIDYNYNIYYKKIKTECTTE